MLQCGSRLLLFGDIDPGADVLDDVTGLIHDRMADRVKVLDRPVTKDDAVLGVELPVLLLRGLIRGSDSRPVVRMNSGVHPVDVGQGLRRVDAAYSQHLGGHAEDSRCEIVSPTATVAQALRLEQIGFAPSQLLFGLLTRIDVRQEEVPPNNLATDVPKRQPA